MKKFFLITALSVTIFTSSSAMLRWAASWVVPAAILPAPKRVVSASERVVPSIGFAEFFKRKLAKHFTEDQRKHVLYEAPKLYHPTTESALELYFYKVAHNLANVYAAGDRECVDNFLQEFVTICTTEEKTDDNEGVVLSPHLGISDLFLVQVIKVFCMRLAHPSVDRYPQLDDYPHVLAPFIKLYNEHTFGRPYKGHPGESRVTLKIISDHESAVRCYRLEIIDNIRGRIGGEYREDFKGDLVIGRIAILCREHTREGSKIDFFIEGGCESFVRDALKLIVRVNEYTPIQRLKLGNCRCTFDQARFEVIGRLEELEHLILHQIPHVDYAVTNPGMLFKKLKKISWRFYAQVPTICIDPRIFPNLTSVECYFDEDEMHHEFIQLLTSCPWLTSLHLLSTCPPLTGWLENRGSCYPPVIGLHSSSPIKCQRLYEYLNVDGVFYRIFPEGEGIWR